MTTDPVGDEVFRLQVKAEGAKRYAQMIAEEKLQLLRMEQMTARDFKLMDGDPLQWRIDGMHAIGDNTTITARYKTGKSTLMLNLLRSLCDGVPFLGHNVTPPSGKIVYWNLEVSDNRMRDWIRRIDIVNDDKIMLVNMRGRRLPLYVEYNEQYVKDWMNEVGAECWIIDPGARLLPGWPGAANPENDNACIAEVVETLDRIKEETSIKDLWIPLHTGRAGADHARGATKWDDWVDARYLMSKKDMNGEEVRVFMADGRDVDVPEFALGFDPLTKRITAEENMEQMQATADARAVVYALLDGPLAGAGLAAATKNVENKRKAQAADDAEKRGWISRRTEGRKTVSYLNEQHPEVELMKIEMRGI